MLFGAYALRHMPIWPIEEAFMTVIPMPRRADHPKRIENRVISAMTLAHRQYGLVAPGDKILVAMSGGKDSYAMLWGLMKIQAQIHTPFELVAYHLDQGQPGHDVAPLRAHLEAQGIPFEIEYQDTYTRVIEKTEPGKIYCSLCSRFRRAILYKAAARHGCNKVALGHHRDDAVETLLLNIFFSGQIKSMPPRLQAESGPQQLIRPLCLAREEDLQNLAKLHEFPILPCNLCGSLQTQRQAMKRMLGELEAHNPHIKGNLLNALQNVVPSHLMDAKLHPFLAAASSPEETDLPLWDMDQKQA